MEASQPTSSTKDGHRAAQQAAHSCLLFFPLAGVVLLMNLVLTEDPQSCIASQSP